MKDALGDRIKQNYEDRTRYLLPRRTYTVIRLDGKAFHTLTRGFDRPYDQDLSEIMDKTAIDLCQEIQGACFAYVQSDEISILLTDFEKPTTCAWFDGNVQKIVSVSAAIATASFNRAFAHRETKLNLAGDLGYKKFYTKDGLLKTAYFDSRVFTIPDPTEVENYFIWRQTDASKNSIQMAARALYSHKELESCDTSDMHELLYKKGINWNDYTSGEKRGRCIIKETYLLDTSKHMIYEYAKEEVERTRWVSLDGRGVARRSSETPLFTQDRNFLRSRIPVMGACDE